MEFSLGYYAHHIPRRMTDWVNEFVERFHVLRGTFTPKVIGSSAVHTVRGIVIIV